MTCIKISETQAANLGLCSKLRNDRNEAFALPHDMGQEMRFRRARYLTLFLAAMFFANSATAAIRACIVDPAHHGEAEMHRLVGNASDPGCPDSDAAGPCLKHHVQNLQNDEQNMWPGMPAAALAPVSRVAPVPVPEPAKRVIAAAAPPLIGPPLTILYRNFRN